MFRLSVHKVIAAVAGVSLGLGLVSAGAASADGGADTMREATPHDAAAKGAHGHGGVSNLVDHGGPVLSSAHLYAIWWGSPGSFPSDAQSGLTDLLTNFGGSHYLQIAQQYMRGASLTTSFAGTFTDTSAPTNKANTTTIQGEIQKVLGTSAPDPNGVYFVFTSNFPSSANYCAWHSAATVNGVAIAQAYMPNTAGIAGCDPGDLYNANSYSEGTRSLANVTAHELMEAITDKLPSGSTYGWIDRNGAEIGDKCAWQFSNSVSVGATSWQLQEEWSNSASGCVQ